MPLPFRGDLVVEKQKVDLFMVRYLVHPKKIIFLQWKCILDTKVVYVSFTECKGGIEKKVFFQSQYLCSGVPIFVYKHGKQSIWGSSSTNVIIYC